MLELERRGIELVIGSIYPPLTSLRHEYIATLCAPIYYAPPQKILKICEQKAKAGHATSKWPANLVAQHDKKYGLSVKAEQRARNALHFAEFFTQSGVDHLHVHFANRAAHTALFLKEISGIPFSVTAHGQDFMKDLGSDELLREICDAAEFVAAETDYSRELLRRRCPDSAAKIHRVYNGIDLERFATPYDEMARPALAPYHVPRIVSIGRLVAFKGFEDLIDACAGLVNRGVDFLCDIIGDGPLYDTLHGKIKALNLSPKLNLLGSLSQQTILKKLRGADIFVLASTTDAQGASDVFPTVILEAMASARPVVSTQLAGIPELVLDGETGILVSPGDPSDLTEALGQLLGDPGLRLRYGRAGRTRIEQHFRIENTVAPLVELFQNTSAASCSHRALGETCASHNEAPTKMTYLIDRWPDRELPLLERELEEMIRRDVPIVPFVCELNSSARLNRDMQLIAPSIQFLPDAIVLEAEWRANPGLAQKLEEERAQQSSCAPGAIFLRQARFALVLRRLLQEQSISHIHATTSRALICALILKKLLGVTVSATIEPRSELPREWIQNALAECVGGRLSNRNLVEQLSESFLLDKTTFRSVPRKTLALINQKTHIDLTTGSSFWQQWAALLLRWNGIRRKSTMENRK
jgi:glycosyltransferase involved in cell wall biosynthesis